MPFRSWPQRIRRRLAAGADTLDAGFTLMEAIVSFMIFAIVSASATYAIINALNASHMSQQRVEAAQTAQVVIADAIRQAETIPEIPPPGITLNPYVGGSDAALEQFKVIEIVVYDAGGSCTTGTMFTVNVEVYQKQSDKFLARSDARVACPRI
jgi:type II secretory pathway pseudopilin PulG